METTEHHDYLWGASSIAKALGVSRRQAYYQLESGYLPARKIGVKWVVSRAELDAFMCCPA